MEGNACRVEPGGVKLPPAAHFEAELERVNRLIAETEKEDYPGRARFLNHLRGRRDVLEFYLDHQRRSGGGAGRTEGSA